jgi:hypothetical protein
VLGSALVYGILWLDLEVRLVTAVAIIVTALLTQLACTRLTAAPARFRYSRRVNSGFFSLGSPAALGVPLFPTGKSGFFSLGSPAAAPRTAFDPRSALISANSLCLLLRTDWVVLAMLAAVVAIASKFTLRVRGKHVFNPTNFALVVMMLATGEVWVSPGQWGSAAVFAFLLASAGSLVVSRAGRADVTFTFLAAWAGLLVGRSLWLGEPLTIPLHRLENGALVVFAFFMISDPRTTPDSRSGRMLFAVLVALGAHLVQFWLFRTNGLLWSLAVCSLAVPLIDWLLPGPRYEWNAGAGNADHERSFR